MNNFHAATGTWSGYYEVAELVATGLPLEKRTHIPVKGKTLGAIPWTSWRENRVLVEEGVAKFPGIEAAKEFLIVHTKGTIFAQVAETLEWPSDAVFKLEYRTKAWPCGWNKTVIFFNEPEEVLEFIAGRREWTLSEDNYFEVDRLEEWDLGPNLIQESDLINRV